MNATQSSNFCLIDIKRFEETFAFRADDVSQQEKERRHREYR